MSLQAYSGLNGISCPLSPRVPSLKVFKIKDFSHLSDSDTVYIQVVDHCLCRFKVPYNNVSGSEFVILWWEYLQCICLRTEVK